jgi:aminopeptidase N
VFVVWISAWLLVQFAAMSSLRLFARAAMVLLGATLAIQAASPDSPEYRKYAPDREVDIEHLTLDVTPDFQKRTVSGSATWKFKPIARPFGELKLDAVALTVSSVTATEKILGYQVTEDQVIVTFADPIPPGREASVTVNYSAQPEKGLYFRTPELGYKPEDMHIWTQGEPHEARYWYPSYDYPNEKFTVEMICHAPEGIVVLANGRKVSEQKDANGLMAVRWLQDKPMVNYLVCLVAGKLKALEDKHGNIPLKFWTPTSEFEHAENSFRGTRDMMEFFEKEIGVPYPWDKYDQVCIQDYHWGGMENTTLTTLTITTLFPKSFENIRSSQGLVAHELAHQWFGDLLTCKDWSHLWLNEGFASFYDLLYTEHKDGRDEFLHDLHEQRKSLTATTNFTKSIVWRKYERAEEQFDSFSYGKGSWVLNMLRNQLGPDLYRQAIRKYVERHKFGVVVTDDLRDVVEEVSGRSFDQFFDQWVHQTGFPRLEVDYAWDERAKVAKLTVRQTQPVSDNVPLFNVPLPVRFKLKSGTVERVLTVKARTEDFTVALESQPELVRIDPGVSVFGVISFRPPGNMLAVQLADKSDAFGRFLAVEQFAERRDGDALARLKTALNNDDC